MVKTLPDSLCSYINIVCHRSSLSKALNAFHTASVSKDEEQKWYHYGEYVALLQTTLGVNFAKCT